MSEKPSNEQLIDDLLRAYESLNEKSRYGIPKGMRLAVIQSVRARILARMSRPVIEVQHPLQYGRMFPAHVVLSDLAAQEGCDGEPYDTMQAVADALRAATQGDAP